MNKAQEVNDAQRKYKVIADWLVERGYASQRGDDDMYRAMELCQRLEANGLHILLEQEAR